MFLRAALVPLLMFAASTAAVAAPIAKVAGLAGAPTDNGQPLSEGSVINEHDRISVGSGNVQLLFNDGTRMVVGSGSTLVVERYLMRGGNTASNFAVDALRGTFRFITGSSPKAAYHIQTANSTIGIRGTGFDFWVDRNTGVVVLEGIVHLARKGGGGGGGGGAGGVDLHAGCEAGIAEAGNTHKLSGGEFASRVGGKLPFLQNQASLKAAFRLNTAACRRVKEGSNTDNDDNDDNNGRSGTRGNPTGPSRTGTTSTGGGGGGGGIRGKP